LVPSDKTIVDVLSLDDFHSTLDARLSEAQAIVAKLVELQGQGPKLGELPDADYVAERYETLHHEHMDRASRLIQSIVAAQVAIATIADNYQTTEERLTANAAEIGSLLDGVSGALIGEQTDAG
jgi:ABC-type transporter Mla subunit MlaD